MNQDDLSIDTGGWSKIRQERQWVRQLIQWRDLVFELVLRDLKIRYKDAKLGFAWTIINPLLQLSVFYFVFKMVMSIDAPFFASTVYVGLLSYHWFQASLWQSAVVATNNRELVMRPAFPVTLLPVVVVTSNMLQLLIELPIVFPFLLLEGGHIQMTAFLLPVLLMLQFFGTLALCYLAASINVIFRDTEQILTVLLSLLFFLTPIFYPGSIIPEHLRFVYRLNPLVGMVEAYRAILIHGQLPQWNTLLPWLLLTVGLMYFGRSFFKRIVQRYVDEL